MSRIKTDIEDHSLSPLLGETNNTEEDLEKRTPLLSICKTSEIRAYKIPPGYNLLGPGYVRKGDPSTIVGQGGVGKSRLALDLAISQITGKNWCGIATGGDPQNWLFIGNENSRIRQKTDLDKAFENLSETEQALVEDHLFIHCQKTPEDSFLGLSEMDVRDRIGNTLKEVNPGAIIFDPLANFVSGDESKTQDMRDTLGLMLRMVRASSPDSAIVLLHHARTGAGNIRQAIGFDSGNFGRGSKVLFSTVRCQMNFVPGDSEDHTRLVLACGKTNDCAPFESRGLIFDPKTFRYDVDPDFDLENWKNDVEGKRGGKVCSIADVVDAVRAGKHRRKEIFEHVHELTGASLSTVKRRIEDARKADRIQLTQPRGTYTLK